MSPATPPGEPMPLHRGDAIVAAFRPTDAGLPTKGPRSFGFDRGGGHTHQGIDMRAPRDAPVRSVADGVVTHASNSLAQGFSGYGRHVVIKHGKKGPWFLFAHLERASVTRGEKVKLGQQIGTVGDTCFSRAHPGNLCRGVHLHFEVSPTRYGTEAHPGQDSEAPRLDPVAWLTRNAHRTPTPTPTPAKPSKPKRLKPPGDWVFLLPVAVLLSGFFIFIAGTTARKWGVVA